MSGVRCGYSGDPQEILIEDAVEPEAWRIEAEASTDPEWARHGERIGSPGAEDDLAGMIGPGGASGALRGSLAGCPRFPRTQSTGSPYVSHTGALVAAKVSKTA